MSAAEETLTVTLLETGADGFARFRDVALPLPQGTPASRLTALAPSGGWQLRRSPPGFASSKRSLIFCWVGYTALAIFS